MKICYLYVFVSTLFLFFSTRVLTQNVEIDSLENELIIHKTNDTTKVNLLNALSISYTDFDINKSDKNAQAAYDLSKQLNFKKGEARSILRLSYNKIQKSELVDAESFAIKALALCEDINNQDCINFSYFCLAKIAYRNNEMARATDYYKKLLDIYTKSGNLLSQADMLNNLGVISYKKGDFDKAIDLYKKAYSIREELGQDKLSLGTLNNIGAICLNQGSYTEALQYFNKCLHLHTEDNNKLGIAQANYNMSAVYYEWKQYDKTLSLLNESLGLYKELEDRRMVAGCLINIGAVYADLKEFPKALDYMTQSMRISEEINDKGELSAGHFQLGDLHLLMEQPNQALKHYKTCLDISLAIEDKLYVSHAHIGLAKSYVLTKNYSKALYHALEGEKIAEDLELLAQKKLTSETLATIYSKTGDYRKAFESHQQFKRVNDSIFNRENIEKITQLESEYKYKRALDSASIRELKLTKTVQATSQDLAKSQRNYLWAIIGVLLVSILLGSVIFYQKLKNAKSKTQNAIIEQKLLRSQMTPHFIFNSLSVLQGMILNKEDKSAILYLTKFSKLLRTILENSRYKMVALSEELSAIDDYMALQNLDIKPPYNYTLLVASNINKQTVKIPPMLIQPFIENATEHAFPNNKDNKEISVELKFEDENLICTIADNGIGINLEKKSTYKNKTSLATTITSERLKMLSQDFETQGSLSIENRSIFGEQGTLVTLVIPYKIELTS